MTALPSDGEIADRLLISPARVHSLLTELYERYDLAGPRDELRWQLADFARRHALVDADD